MSKISKLLDLAREIEGTRSAAALAQRSGDYEAASRLTYGDLPQLEARLEQELGGGHDELRLLGRSADRMVLKDAEDRLWVAAPLDQIEFDLHGSNRG